MSEAFLDRRGFLRATAGGGLAIAVVSVLPGGLRATGAQGLKSLTRAEFDTAVAAAEALLAGTAIEARPIVERIDAELWAVGGAIEEDMRTVLQLIGRLTILGGHLRGFTELGPEARLAYLHTWRDSRFTLRRAAFNAIKSFVYFFAYADPQTWPLTGFPGTWPDRGVPVPARPVDFGEIA